MKLIEVTKNNECVSRVSIQDGEVSEWVDFHVNNNTFGKPERWVREAEVANLTVLDTKIVIDVQSQDQVLNENGDVIQEAVEEVSHIEMLVPAEYSINVIDITALEEQKAINLEALKYLADTDWYIIREMDSGEPCPSDIKQLRAEARLRVL